MPSEEDLNAATFQAYLHLVKAGKPVGPRDLMRSVNLSSPAVAHRTLQKLVDLGMADKDAYGRYIVKEKVDFKGYMWLGRSLVPRFILNGFFLLGILFVEVIAFLTRLANGDAVGSTEFLLVGITAFSAASFLAEGLRLKNKIRK